MQFPFLGYQNVGRRRRQLHSRRRLWVTSGCERVSSREILTAAEWSGATRSFNIIILSRRLHRLRTRAHVKGKPPPPLPPPPLPLIRNHREEQQQFLSPLEQQLGPKQWDRFERGSENDLSQDVKACACGF